MATINSIVKSRLLLLHTINNNNNAESYFRIEERKKAEVDTPEVTLFFLSEGQSWRLGEPLVIVICECM